MVFCLFCQFVMFKIIFFFLTVISLYTFLIWFLFCLHVSVSSLYCLSLWRINVRIIIDNLWASTGTRCNRRVNLNEV